MRLRIDPTCDTQKHTICSSDTASLHETLKLSEWYKCKKEYFLERDKGDRCVGQDNRHFKVLIVLKSGSLILLEPYGPVQACNGIALPLFTFTLLGLGAIVHS